MSNFHLMCGFMSLAVYLFGSDVSLLFKEERKESLSSLGLSGPADKTSRPSVVTSWRLWRSKLAEMQLANVNYTVDSLVVKHNDSTKILPTFSL